MKLNIFIYILFTCNTDTVIFDKNNSLDACIIGNTLRDYFLSLFPPYDSPEVKKVQKEVIFPYLKNKDTCHFVKSILQFCLIRCPKNMHEHKANKLIQESINIIKKENRLNFKSKKSHSEEKCFNGLYIKIESKDTIEDIFMSFAKLMVLSVEEDFDLMLNILMSSNDGKKALINNLKSFIENYDDKDAKKLHVQFSTEKLKVTDFFCEDLIDFICSEVSERPHAMQLNLRLELCLDTYLKNMYTNKDVVEIAGHKVSLVSKHFYKLKFLYVFCVIYLKNLHLCLVNDTIKNLCLDIYMKTGIRIRFMSIKLEKEYLYTQLNNINKLFETNKINKFGEKEIVYLKELFQVDQKIIKTIRDFNSYTEALEETVVIKKELFTTFYTYLLKEQENNVIYENEKSKINIKKEKYKKKRNNAKSTEKKEEMNKDSIEKNDKILESKDKKKNTCFEISATRKSTNKKQIIKSKLNNSEDETTKNDLIEENKKMKTNKLQYESENVEHRECDQVFADEKFFFQNRYSQKHPNHCLKNKSKKEDKIVSSNNETKHKASYNYTENEDKILSSNNETKNTTTCNDIEKEDPSLKSKKEDKIVGSNNETKHKASYNYTENEAKILSSNNETKNTTTCNDIEKEDKIVSSNNETKEKSSYNNTEKEDPLAILTKNDKIEGWRMVTKRRIKNKEIKNGCEETRNDMRKIDCKLDDKIYLDYQENKNTTNRNSQKKKINILDSKDDILFYNNKSISGKKRKDICTRHQTSNNTNNENVEFKEDKYNIKEHENSNSNIDTYSISSSNHKYKNKKSHKSDTVFKKQNLSNKSNIDNHKYNVKKTEELNSILGKDDLFIRSSNKRYDTNELKEFDNTFDDKNLLYRSKSDDLNYDIKEPKEYNTYYIKHDLSIPSLSSDQKNDIKEPKKFITSLNNQDLLIPSLSSDDKNDVKKPKKFIASLNNQDLLIPSSSSDHKNDIKEPKELYAISNKKDLSIPSSSSDHKNDIKEPKEFNTNIHKHDLPNNSYSSQQTNTKQTLEDNNAIPNNDELVIASTSSNKKLDNNEFVKDCTNLDKRSLSNNSDKKFKNETEVISNPTPKKRNLSMQSSSFDNTKEINKTRNKIHFYEYSSHETNYLIPIFDNNSTTKLNENKTLGIPKNNINEDKNNDYTYKLIFTSFYFINDILPEFKKIFIKQDEYYSPNLHCQGDLVITVVCFCGLVKSITLRYLYMISSKNCFLHIFNNTILDSDNENNMIHYFNYEKAVLVSSFYDEPAFFSQLNKYNKTITDPRFMADSNNSIFIGANIQLSSICDDHLNMLEIKHTRVLLSNVGVTFISVH